MLSKQWKIGAFWGLTFLLVCFFLQSFAFYLFEPMGISFKQLTNRLIELAFAGAKEKKASTFAFDSKILEKASNGIKTVKK